MRYHAEEPEYSVPVFGKVHICDHPVYSRCTLYRDGERGLAVIQQRYDLKTKHTYWTELDAWIANKLYLDPGFNRLFGSWAKPGANDIFPTLTIRQAMWLLRMKPLKREPWETLFDHKPI